MNEDLYYIEIAGKKYVGTYAECQSVVEEIYQKTRKIIGIVKKKQK